MKTTELTKLAGKLRIRGQIRVETGLHIGGTSEALEIGSLSLDIIKTSKGVPYIPGSSLKGKLRSMLAYREGSRSASQDSREIKEIFGDSGDRDDSEFRGRLIVRDAFLDEAHFQQEFRKDRLKEPFVEHKTENNIKRASGTAQHPRTQARVPRGAQFEFCLIFDVLQQEGGPGDFWSGHNKELVEELLLAMRMLEDDYLGGSGTRGYGQVAFVRESLRFEYKTIRDYENPQGTWSALNHYSLHQSPQPS